MNARYYDPGAGAYPRQAPSPAPLPPATWQSNAWAPPQWDPYRYPVLPAPPAPHRPDHRPWLLWGLAGTVILLVAFAGAVSIARARNDGPLAPSASAPAAGTVPPAPTQTPTTAPTQAPASHPSAATATSVPPTATAAAPTATPAPQPHAVPAGWKVYRGASVPIVMAYPPDWTVDEADIAKGVVYFRSPYEKVWLAVAVRGLQPAGANVDVLRDQYFQGVTRACDEAGIETTRYNTFAGVTFAALAATCAANGNLWAYYIGAGLKNGVEWDFQMHARYADYNDYATRFFTPMLTSLNIYANPAPVTPQTQ